MVFAEGGRDLYYESVSGVLITQITCQHPSNRTMLSEQYGSQVSLTLNKLDNKICNCLNSTRQMSFLVIAPTLSRKAARPLRRPCRLWNTLPVQVNTDGDCMFLSIHMYFFQKTPDGWRL